MVSIKDRKILRQMFSHYDYVMTTAQLSKEKLYYRDIQRMLGAGLIEKVKRGYYHWTMGSGKGDVVIISRLFPDGILCMETALFYYGYSDRNPAEWNIAIDKNTSRQRTRIDYPSVKAYRIEPTILSIGATRGEINFTDVRIYDRDRTICDVLRNMNKMDKELFNKAIQGYVNDPQKNVPNLIEYNRYALLFIRGERPVMDFKYDIMKHPNVKLTADGGQPPYIHGEPTQAVATLVFDSDIPQSAVSINAVSTSYELLSDEDLEEIFNI